MSCGSAEPQFYRSTIVPTKTRKRPSVVSHLAPTRLLLEAIPDLLGCLADCQVLSHVAALPAALLQLHAQREILSEGPRRRPAALLERIGADQKVGACAALAGINGRTRALNRRANNMRKQLLAGTCSQENGAAASRTAGSEQRAPVQEMKERAS